MKILEFDLPLQIYPKRPYRINKLNLIILSTDNPAPRNDYVGPRTATKIIIYNTEYKTVKKILTDFVIFINFLNQEFYSFFWLFDRSFLDFSQYERNINNLDQYLKDSFKDHDWYWNVDYNQFPLLEIRPDPTRLNFRYYFTKFHQLPSDSKLRTWISFFAYDSITSLIMTKIYDNSNLHISNSFILLEALVKSKIKNQKGNRLCPNCGALLPDKRNIMELIYEFLKTRLSNPETLKTLISILKKHNSARNTFIHNAKYETAFEKEEKMRKKLGRNEFTIYDEIEHAGATRSGLYVVNSIIRLELLNMLKTIRST